MIKRKKKVRSASVAKQVSKLYLPGLRSPKPFEAKPPATQPALPEAISQICVVGMREHTLAHAPNHSLMPPHEQLKGRFIPLCDEALQQMAIRYVAGGLCTSKFPDVS